jgi:4-methyl-5(b-hydroxyethyl)-thiazole monophosphate biosynthesis
MSKVIVLLANGFEEIEAVTIIDILRRGCVEVITASLEELTVTGSHGIKLIADSVLDTVLEAQFDMIVLPGGMSGTTNLKGDQRVLQLVRRMAQQGKYVAAICAAPSVLAEAGLLDGRNATSYPGSLDAYPNVHRQEAAIVEDGKIITSTSPGSAMDFALILLERLVDVEQRQKIEAGLVRECQFPPCQMFAALT